MLASRTRVVARKRPRPRASKSGDVLRARRLVVTKRTHRGPLSAPMAGRSIMLPLEEGLQLGPYRGGVRRVEFMTRSCGCTELEEHDVPPSLTSGESARCRRGEEDANAQASPARQRANARDCLHLSDMCHRNSSGQSSRTTQTPIAQQQRRRAAAPRSWSIPFRERLPTRSWTSETRGGRPQCSGRLCLPRR
jgi:hypothetical protein